MKRVQVRKLEGIVAKNNVVVAQFTSDRCVPCRRQENAIHKICSEKGSELTCVSINIDENQKGIGKMKNYGIARIPSVIPYTMVYVNGEIQHFRDNTLLDGEKTNHLIGERTNIEMAINQAIKNSKNKSLNHQ